MGRPIVRIGIAIGIVLLALGGLAMLLPTSSSAGEGGLPVNLTPRPPSLGGKGESLSPLRGGVSSQYVGANPRGRPHVGANPRGRPLPLPRFIEKIRGEDREEVTPVCFWSAQGPICVERPVESGAAGPDAEGLLAALLAGPTPQERARGIWSAIPEDTTLEGLEVRPDGTVVVRLGVPLEPLRLLDHTTFEIIVHQIGWTLEPLGWRHLHIQTWDPIAGEFVPLAVFLPQVPALRKETALTGEGGPEISPPYVGQPPAPGQGQPPGALTGKTVYVSAGHGWEWNDYVDAWRTQRPPYPNPPYDDGPIIEDHNNAEAVNQYLLQYLWNAGARVIPVRERDMNEAEVVVDGDDPATGSGYFETGAWTAATGTGYAGTDYRWTETVIGSPTATAVWTATLPTDSHSAVYVWYRQGDTHTPDARYTIHHAGGATDVVVNQQIHGDTWHYVGTYGFRGGDEARVVLTNQSNVVGRVVVADAVRFGGGTFDDLDGIETSASYPPDEPWWEVAAYYQVQRMGMDPGDWPYFNDIVARPMYARWEHAGTGEDAVYVSWHTNGVSGYQWHSRGTISIIHNGEGKQITPGSEALRDAIHSELIGDIRAGWDPTWPGHKRSMNLGELRELWDDVPAVRMPGALIEIAYHDHPDDTDTLKEPRFNMLAARAMYQGIVKYFEQRDGVDLIELPETPTYLAVQNAGGGQVRVSWRPSLTDTVGLVGDPATGYRLYTSTAGLGWSDGVPVATTAYTLTGLAEGQLLFVRVAATNDGGESFPTETLAARVGDDTEVLLVNGFDRLNRTMLVPDYYAPTDEVHLRIFLDRMNRYDYIIQHAEVISYPFDSASNEAVQAGRISLGDYVLLDWILGEESAPDETLDATERALLGGFLDSGGALFLSGTEVGYHLDHLGAAPDFYNTVLRADYAGDDAGTYEVAPATGSTFEGLAPFRFDAPGMYDADYPDQMTRISGSVDALVYQGESGGTAAVQYADGCQRLVYFGFPFETIRPDQRPVVMGRVLDFLDECLSLPVITKIVTPVSGSAHRTKPAFEGTAEAGETATLDRVAVQIQRASDGQYWMEKSVWLTGTSWLTVTGWVTAETWVTATGTASWSYALPALDDGDYRLRARAWTTDAYSDTSPAAVVFTYDTIPPASTTLIAPTGGVTIPVGTVTLAWEAVEPDGGSGLAYVVQLDGQPYTTTQPVYTVTSIAEGLHTWGVQVFDAAVNRSEWVTDTFYVSCHHLWLPLAMRNFERGSECTDVLVNGGFESDEGWVLNRLATYDTANVHAGARSVRVGILPGEAGGGAVIFSSVAQTITLPAGGAANLRLWVYPIGEGGDLDDHHYVVLFDQWEGFHLLDRWQSDAQTWEQWEYDLSEFLGQTVTLYVGTKNDGDDDTAALYVDDAVLEVCP